MNGRGFTLLEVLVALAVLAIALGAVIRLAASAADNATYLRDRTLAGWVAANRINELLLEPVLADNVPARGERPMAGRDWHWDLTVLSTDDPSLVRLEVAVRAAAGGPELVRLVAFHSHGGQGSP